MRSGNWPFSRVGKTPEYPMKEPNVPMYRNEMVQVWRLRAALAKDR